MTLRGKACTMLTGEEALAAIALTGICATLTEAALRAKKGVDSVWPRLCRCQSELSFDGWNRICQPHRSVDLPRTAGRTLADPAHRSAEQDPRISSRSSTLQKCFGRPARRCHRVQRRRRMREVMHQRRWRSGVHVLTFRSVQALRLPADACFATPTFTVRHATFAPATTHRYVKDMRRCLRCAY